MHGQRMPCGMETQSYPVQKILLWGIFSMLRFSCASSDRPDCGSHGPRNMLYPKLAAELSGVHMVLIWQSNGSLCQDFRNSVNEVRQCVVEKDAHRSWYVKLCWGVPNFLGDPSTLAKPETLNDCLPRKDVGTEWLGLVHERPHTL